ncbi:M15 family metallopeptidase [Fusobacterium necrophorum]|uniref:M15 family metallopeptidase n=1 Tax=Fusobacterium necrophorum TaxID=859 RepID=UPI00254DEA52|nr:M15 family metallopeptidase [Fusobacterium necrophorum]MDK4472575.1 M15 family metallopeptidase [Fusobacterium necrophorum]MDK4479534.1 M15 family metallopeptidase [Fusobacterium necrophorum]MDK4495487.1 M15 family metallopeptidase [Fusobacterium necrophorum]MDK4510337.1 M15 family metallopeptidase [Fusobacterium necrophorum]MDK4518234.1 M15 family metallopeptidase [Fusobacterium necrophorum]
MYNFSERSIKNLKGVHPKLVALVKEAIKDSPYDFIITEGLRTVERQKELVRTGKSQTMNSYHLRGHAVDIALIVNGTINWEFALYREVANHIKKRAKELGIKITWGGDWKRLKDGPHFQIEGV